MPRQIASVTFKITCDEPGRADAVAHLAETAAALDTTISESEYTAPRGIEHRTNRSYRLGDYFSRVQVFGAQPDDPTSVRVVFQPREGADKYWKDLMVAVIRHIREAVPGLSVKMTK